VRSIRQAWGRSPANSWRATTTRSRSSPSQARGRRRDRGARFKPRNGSSWTSTSTQGSVRGAVGAGTRTATSQSLAGWQSYTRRHGPHPLRGRLQPADSASRGQRPHVRVPHARAVGTAIESRSAFFEGVRFISGHVRCARDLIYASTGRARASVLPGGPFDTLRDHAREALRESRRGRPSGPHRTPRRPSRLDRRSRSPFRLNPRRGARAPRGPSERPQAGEGAIGPRDAGDEEEIEDLRARRSGQWVREETSSYLGIGAWPLVRIAPL